MLTSSSCSLRVKSAVHRLTSTLALRDRVMYVCICWWEGTKCPKKTILGDTVFEWAYLQDAAMRGQSYCEKGRSEVGSSPSHSNYSTILFFCPDWSFSRIISPFLSMASMSRHNRIQAAEWKILLTPKHSLNAPSEVAPFYLWQRNNWPNCHAKRYTSSFTHRLILCAIYGESYTLSKVKCFQIYVLLLFVILFFRVYPPE